MKKHLIFFLILCLIPAAAACFSYRGGAGNQDSIWSNPARPEKAKIHYSEIKTRQDAVKFLRTKFSIAELLGFKKMVRDGLTAREKDELKSIFQSRLSDREYAAIYTFILNEIN